MNGAPFRYDIKLLTDLCFPDAPRLIRIWCVEYMLTLPKRM